MLLESSSDVGYEIRLPLSWQERGRDVVPAPTRSNFGIGMTCLLRLDGPPKLSLTADIPAYPFVSRHVDRHTDYPSPIVYVKLIASRDSTLHASSRIYEARDAVD